MGRLDLTCVNGQIIYWHQKVVHWERKCRNCFARVSCTSTGNYMGGLHVVAAIWPCCSFMLIIGQCKGGKERLTGVPDSVRLPTPVEGVRAHLPTRPESRHCSNWIAVTSKNYCSLDSFCLRRPSDWYICCLSAWCCWLSVTALERACFCLPTIQCIFTRATLCWRG